MKKLITAGVCALLLTGCATQQGLVASKPGMLKQEQTNHFIFWGLGQTITTNAATACGNAANVARVESHLSPLNIVFSTVTFGLYSPRQARVYCK